MKEKRVTCDQCKKTLLRYENDEQVEPQKGSADRKDQYLVIGSMERESTPFHRGGVSHFCNHACAYKWLVSNFYSKSDPIEDECKKKYDLQPKNL